MWKQAEEIAIKRDPEKWEAAKQDAVSRMGGKHSARAMQLATKLYKDRGGEYAGKKPHPSDNSLRTWTKQKWQWSGGDTPGQGGRGVYLPARSASALKGTSSGRDKLKNAAAVKRSATRRGEQFSRHGLHVGKDRSKTAHVYGGLDMYKLAATAASPDNKDSRDRADYGGNYRFTDRVKDLGVAAVGAGIGAGVGYLAMRHMTGGEYGRALRNLGPNTRLKYLVPAATAATGGLALMHIARSKERQRIRAKIEKRAFVEDWVYRSLWGRS